jgi:hypothetical protein
MAPYVATEGTSFVPKVTLYVKDSDAAVWEKARALAGAGDESLSALVTDAVRQRVALLEGQRKIDAGDTTTITLAVGEPEKKLRFTGRLIASRRLDGADTQIYQMKDRRIVWFQERRQGNVYDIHESLEDLADKMMGQSGALDEVTILLEEAFAAAGEEFLIDLD